tara:strand:+ start:12 stop:695 length:684 start_codon:yes stop_codon:yes gene_type:complete
MSFTNSNYDKEAYKQSLNRSVGPGIYRLNEPSISCEPCYPYPPTVRLQRGGDSIRKDMFLIDVDSELSGITRKLSKDTSKQYIPTCPDNACTSGEVCGQGVIGECKDRKPGERYEDNNLKHYRDCFIPAEHSRISNPSCNLRGTGWNRWEWLCKNPQERIEIPFDFNISNRILSKDNHRPCIPNPIDHEPLMPKGGDLPCEPIVNTCANYTNPSSVHWQKPETIERY